LEVARLSAENTTWKKVQQPHVDLYCFSKDGSILVTVSRHCLNFLIGPSWIPSAKVMGCPLKGISNFGGTTKETGSSATQIAI
jgi:hypothetical protein